MVRDAGSGFDRCAGEHQIVLQRRVVVAVAVVAAVLNEQHLLVGGILHLVGDGQRTVFRDFDPVEFVFQTIGGSSVNRQQSGRLLRGLNKVGTVAHGRNGVIQGDIVADKGIVVAVVDDLAVDQTGIYDFLMQDFKWNILTILIAQCKLIHAGDNRARDDLLAVIG